MRVIAGTARGTSLVAPRGMKTRPTADRVREALFSILLSRCTLQGVRVLDICAGTGALGIEALSRGAGSCTFIERDRQALDALRRNLSAAGMLDRSSISSVDAPAALRGLGASGAAFDLIFFDPPYQSDLYASVPPLVAGSRLLAPEGIMVIERASRSTPLPDCAGLIQSDSRRYGDTVLEFFTSEAA